MRKTLSSNMTPKQKANIDDKIERLGLLKQDGPSIFRESTLNLLKELQKIADIKQKKLCSSTRETSINEHIEAICQIRKEQSTIIKYFNDLEPDIAIGFGDWLSLQNKTHLINPNCITSKVKTKLENKINDENIATRGIEWLPGEDFGFSYRNKHDELIHIKILPNGGYSKTYVNSNFENAGVKAVIVYCRDGSVNQKLTSKKMNDLLEARTARNAYINAQLGKVSDAQLLQDSTMQKRINRLNRFKADRCGKLAEFRTQRR